MQWIYDISEYEWASCYKIQLNDEHKHEYFLDQSYKHLDLCAASGQKRSGNRIQLIKPWLILVCIKLSRWWDENQYNIQQSIGNVSKYHVRQAYNYF